MEVKDFDQSVAEKWPLIRANISNTMIKLDDAIAANDYQAASAAAAVLAEYSDTIMLAFYFASIGVAAKTKG